MAHSTNVQLKVGLSGWDASALVVGSIIGTGVFLKAATMAQSTGSPLWVFLALLFAGLLSMAGALSYAELGARYPRAGGEYVFLREGYGDFVAFLYGWSRFWIGSPGSIAAYAVGAATFISGLASGGMLPGGKLLWGLAFVAFFTGLNCLAVQVGGKVQTFLTGLKVMALLGVAFSVLFAGAGGSWEHLSVGGSFAGGGWPGWTAFGSAVVAALWAFDGWNNLPMVASEVRDPQRNVPRAIIGGTLLVFVIYLLVNLAYFYALPFADVVSSSSTAYPDAPPVAARAFAGVAGPLGVIVLAVVMTVSALGSLNGSVLTNSRVPYAMARDGVFLKFLAAVQPSTHVPMRAVLIQGAVAAVLALTGSFDQLTDAVVFSSWIFYALAAGSLFALRRKNRKASVAATYQVPGHPWVPLVFVGVAIALLGVTVVTNVQGSLLGLGFMVAGVVVFALTRRR